MELDPFSQMVSDRLLQEFPQLTASVKTGHSPGRLLIEHPSPHADLSLYVSTEDGEITIGLDGWHTHIGMFEDLDENQELTSALDLVRSILCDELVVAVRFKNGQWAGSAIIDPDNAPAVAEGEEVMLKRWTGIIRC